MNSESADRNQSQDWKVTDVELTQDASVVGSLKESVENTRRMKDRQRERSFFETWCLRGHISLFLILAQL